MAELADAADSKSAVRKGLRVRVPPSAPRERKLVGAGAGQVFRCSGVLVFRVQGVRLHVEELGDAFNKPPITLEVNVFARVRAVFAQLGGVFLED